MLINEITCSLDTEEDIKHWGLYDLPEKKLEDTFKIDRDLNSSDRSPLLNNYMLPIF